MKLRSQITALFVSTTVALATVDANAAGGPAYAAYGGINYQQQGEQQVWYDQPRQETQAQQQLEQLTVENATTEEAPLPPGWSEHFDPNSGQYYYYNSADGTTTWDRPLSESQGIQPPDDDLEEDIKHDDVETLLGDANDSQAEASSLQANQQDHMSPKISWDAQQDSHPLENAPQQQASAWEPDGRPLQQPIQHDTPVSTNNDHSNDTPQRQEWGGNRMIQQPATEAQVPNGPERPKQSQQISSDLGSPQPAGWGPPKDQVSQQQTQPSNGWGSPHRAQGQQPNGWNANTNSVTEQMTTQQKKQPENQQQIPGWGMSKSVEPSSHDQPREHPHGNPPSSGQHSGNMHKINEVPSLSSTGQTQNHDHAPVETETPKMELARAHYQQQSPDRQYGAFPQQQQGQGRHQQPPAGQNIPQNQRPQYGVGQGHAGSQHPANVYNNQYQQHSNSQQYRPYGAQQQTYGQPLQQQTHGQIATRSVDDGSAVVKEAIGKSWQGLLGFTNRTREAVGQARDQVVASASVAGQTIGERSTSLWGQAKSAFGSVFEKNDDMQSSYGMSTQSIASPPQGYPGALQQGQSQQGRQVHQGYPPHYPSGRYGPSRGQSPQQLSNGHQSAPIGEQRQHQNTQQRGPQGQMNDPRMRPRGDAPYPHQRQQGARGPYQAQYGGNSPPRPGEQHQAGPGRGPQVAPPRPGGGGQAGIARGAYQGSGPPRPGGLGQTSGGDPTRPRAPPDQRVPGQQQQRQQQQQQQHDPWAHPGLSSDI